MREVVMVCSEQELIIMSWLVKRVVSYSVARCTEKSVLIWIFIRKSAKGTEIQREYGFFFKNTC